jgi:type IV pilus assembly protein PilM
LRQGLLKELHMTEVIGLDIGSHSIKLIGLRMTSKGPFLTHAGIKEIPYGVEKEDVNAFSEILKALVKEVGLKSKKVNLVVSGPGVQIKRISVPSLPKAELKEAVRWEIKEQLPFPVETAQIDFHILNEYVEDNVKKLALITVACQKHLIDRTLSIVKGAGLEPIHLDVGPFALWNTLSVWDQLKKEEIVALVDMGAEETGIYIFKDKILQFSREVTPGGTDITRAIMDGIGSDGEPVLLFERAEGMKQEMGIPSESFQEALRQAQDALQQAKNTTLSKISFLVRPVLEKLVAEIGRSLEYYRNLFNEEQIDRLLLTGGGANLKNIVSFLASELRLPVEHFNPLGNILFDLKQIDIQLLEQSGSIFTIAAGIALPDPKRIELLPAKEPFLSKIKVGKLVPILTPGIIFFIFLAIIWYTNGQVTTVQKERDAKVAKVENLDTLQAKLKLLKEKDLQIKENISLFPSSMIVPIPYRDILKEVSHMLPDNVTLTLLAVQYKEKPSKGESQTDEGRELHMSGLTFGNDMNCLTSLALIIERLERSSLFKNVKLMSADENKLYNRSGAKFNIVCDINLNGQIREP